MKRLLWLAFTASCFGQTLTLREAIDVAEKQSPDVQAARIQMLEARAATLIAQSALKPQASAYAAMQGETRNLQGIGLAFPGFPERVGPYRVFDARPTASLRVIDLSLLSKVRAAQAREKQSSAKVEVVAEATRAAIVGLYLQALEADSLARSARARIATAEEVLKQANDALDAGRASKLDTSRASEQLESERAALVVAERQRDTITLLLQETIGMKAESPIALADLDDRTSDWSVAEIHRPESAALEAESAVLDREIEAAKRQQRPTFDVSANYGALGRDPAHATSTWTVGGSVLIPLWTSGRIANEVRIAKLKREELAQSQRKLDLQIAREVSEALLAGRAAEEERRHRLSAAAAAKETLDLSRLRYENGLAVSLDVVTAQSNLAQAEEESIRALYRTLTAQANLARAQGNMRDFVNR